MLQTITLLKRNNDQQQGTVRAVKLFDCRQSMVFKTGEPIAGDETSNHYCIWHIPRREMDRAGVAYINAADRIVNTGADINVGGTWQPESTTKIVARLFRNQICVSCLRVDP